MKCFRCIWLLWWNFLNNLSATCCNTTDLATSYNIKLSTEMTKLVQIVFSLQTKIFHWSLVIEPIPILEDVLSIKQFKLLVCDENKAVPLRLTARA